MAIKLQDRFTTFTYAFCVLTIILEISYILISWSKLPPQIPIFYSRPWGRDILSAPIFIWLLPGFFAICFVLNYFISNFFGKEDLFLARTIKIFNVSLAILTLWGTYKIISLIV